MNYDKLTKEEIIKILDDTLGYIDKQEKEIERLCNALNEVIERNSKAIEYLKNNACFNDKYFCDDLDIYECKELYNILQGSD